MAAPTYLRHVFRHSGTSLEAFANIEPMVGNL